jgi:hypothetical protein
VEPDINEYFRTFRYDPQPAHGSPPTAVVWAHVGELEVRGFRVYVGDSWAIVADGVQVNVLPGIYRLDAECFAYGQDGRVARLRGILSGRVPTSRRPAGHFSVDVASAGVIDADSIEAWACDDPEAFEAWGEAFVDSRIDDHDIAGFFFCPGARVSMVHISTGFGDGTYAIHQLMDGGDVVGFELEFLKPGQGYFEEPQSDTP